MNISTGGPHILLFERDQQLITLLTSEFQLAGYECHVARTAVEVFDSIARYPIRMVLVDMAQAAATRREFWVALDTQCRGRGVQVMTFQCANIAGYGPHDPDDRTYAAVDLHVDGMFGLMNMVDAVRSRIPVMPSSNTLTRIPRTSSLMPSYIQTSTVSSGTPSPRTNMTTEPRSNRTNASTSPSGGQQPAIQSTSSSLQSANIPHTGSIAGGANGQGGQPASYTDKIRAVLYPTTRSRSGQSNLLDGASNEHVTNAMPTLRARGKEQMEQKERNETTVQTEPASNLSMLQQLANGQNGNGESGLAQLSRMVQESRPVFTSEGYDTSARQSQTSRMSFDTASLAAFGATSSTSSLPTNTVAHSSTAPTMAPLPTAPSASPSPTPETGSTQPLPLRASPIEGLPIERGERTTSALSSALPITGETHSAGSSYTNYGYEQASAPNAHPPLASLSASGATTREPPAQSQTTSSSSVESVAHSSAEKRSDGRVTDEQKGEQVGTREDAVQEQAQPSRYEEAVTENASEGRLTQEQLEAAQLAAVLKAAQASQDAVLHERPMDANGAGERMPAASMPSNATLLDIVQSLPPMPPPPSQQQVLSGRATRSLSSVLLEGHLVPQNRLEVAQNIQRMLRGVDLNYQLGEILLMFKLLTPDQLLAASLVSYGLITTQQIASLGRIRQELHAMGLEYDLETLLILFRILTPEQLREVRSSW